MTDLPPRFRDYLTGSGEARLANEGVLDLADEAARVWSKFLETLHEA